MASKNIFQLFQYQGYYQVVNNPSPNSCSRDPLSASIWVVDSPLLSVQEKFSGQSKPNLIEWTFLKMGFSRLSRLWWLSAPLSHLCSWIFFISLIGSRRVCKGYYYSSSQEGRNWKSKLVLSCGLPPFLSSALQLKTFPLPSQSPATCPLCQLSQVLLRAHLGLLAENQFDLFLWKWFKYLPAEHAQVYAKVNNTSKADVALWYPTGWHISARYVNFINIFTKHNDLIRPTCSFV